MFFFNVWLLPEHKASVLPELNYPMRNDVSNLGSCVTNIWFGHYSRFGESIHGNRVHRIVPGTVRQDRQWCLLYMISQKSTMKRNTEPWLSFYFCLTFLLSWKYWLFLGYRQHLTWGTLLSKFSEWPQTIPLHNITVMPDLPLAQAHFPARCQLGPGPYMLLFPLSVTTHPFSASKSIL